MWNDVIALGNFPPLRIRLSDWHGRKEFFDFYFYFYFFGNLESSFVCSRQSPDWVGSILNGSCRNRKEHDDFMAMVAPPVLNGWRRDYVKSFELARAIPSSLASLPHA